ncbi:hypothetical protein DDT52_13615 [Brenneria roseae subsp. roseae]|nr:hypothetical protein DDT52_13615 [Brenneria roseae subsp. roseae]
MELSLPASLRQAIASGVENCSMTIATRCFIKQEIDFLLILFAYKFINWQGNRREAGNHPRNYSYD